MISRNHGLASEVDIGLWFVSSEPSAAAGTRVDFAVTAAKFVGLAKVAVENPIQRDFNNTVVLSNVLEIGTP